MQERKPVLTRAALAAILLVAGVWLSPAWAQEDYPAGITPQPVPLQDQNGGEALPPPPTPAPYSASPPPVPDSSPPDSGPSDMTAQLLERVQTLEDQVRSLRGQVEELQNQAQRQQADFTKQLSDLSFQIQQGQGAGAKPPMSQPMSSPPGVLALPASNGAAAVAPPPPAAPLHRTAEQVLQDGAAALARRDYAAAEAAAREILAGGRGPHAYEAQFLLAQAQVGQRNYQQAAIAFDDAYNRNRAGSRAQDSLLGLAHALYNLGDKRAACGALNKLQAAFPVIRSDLRENVAGLRGRSGCG